MRVIRDGFVHIDNNLGQRLHTKVRAQESDDGRIAVFLNPNAGPQHVYRLADVIVSKTSGNCSHPVCFGKATRQKLARLWESQEAAHV